VHYYFAMTRYPTKELYRQAWADAHHTDPAVPLNVDIELASLCNLACPFCFWGEADFNTQMLAPAADGKAKKRLMPTELALRIIDEAAEIGVPALKFNWRGESTIHPDYSSILKYARALYRNGSRGDGGISKLSRPAFHELLVNTNANCKDHAIEGLMAATKVMVSLDSTVPETYKVMRVNGSLDRATEVIRELIRRGHPNLWVRRVITTANQAEPFAQRVRDLFGPAVHVSEHACFDRNVDEHHQTMDPLRFERTYCGYPSQRIMVASDGNCYPCCVDYDGTMAMGDTNKQGLMDIWGGENFRRLRAELRGNQFVSKACQNCTSWMAYKSKNREMVQDREIVL
jgi:radical SAM protein with 4Fe4S-binding SPASM domain